jgi:ankyrin repeat protein
MRICRSLFFAVLCTALSSALCAEIHDAVAANNLERVKALLAENPKLIDSREDANLATPLHWATTKEMAELLIANKADVNAKARGGFTPLHFSVKALVGYLIRNTKSEIRATSEKMDDLEGQAYPGVTEALLAHGVSVDVSDDAGSTPLMLAANKEVAEILIAHGAAVDAHDKHARTALFTVSSAEVTEYLLSLNLDLNARDDAGNTPLHSTWDPGKAMVLIKHHADVNALNNSGRSPLFFESGGDARTATLLIVNDARVDIVDKSGMTALKAALEHRRYDVGLAIATGGAKVDVFDAATLGLKDKLALLLKSDPKLANAHDKANRTPLHWAVMRSQVDAVQLLLGNGAEVDARDETERTPLICAGRAKPEIARMLLEHKADIDAFDKEGHCVLEEAMSFFPREQYRMLQSFRRKGSSELTEAISSGDTSKVQQLLEADPLLVRTRDESAATPLHWAAAKGSVLLVKMLIQYKADVNAISYDEGTPLLDAAILGQKENARILIENGATVDFFSAAALGMKDKVRELLDADPALVWVTLHGGQTPLHLAARTGQTAVVELLISEKANVNATDHNGLTPLDYALTSNEDALATLLRRNGGKIGKLSE